MVLFIGSGWPFSCSSFWEARLCLTANPIIFRRANYTLDPDFDFLINEGEADPIAKLSAAIIRRAFLDLSEKNNYTRASAWRWLFTDDRDYEFSFENCCTYLGIRKEVITSKIFDYVQ